jgi:hypothetical protein
LPPPSHASKVTLTPQFSPTTDNATNITLRLDHLSNSTSASHPFANQPLLQLDLNHGYTPTQQYNGTDLSVSDTLGRLPLTHTDTNTSDALRTWYPARDPQGPVVVRFRAVPRVTDASTLSGPRIDLRADQGGEIGMGTGFLPLPPAGEGEDWEMVVEWVLPEEGVGSGVRVASSLGDGVRETAVGLPGRVLAKAYFAVGELQRWPRWEVESEEGERPFYVYWIGKLPYGIEKVGRISKEMHGAISSFFGDADSRFRVFWRRVSAGYGGTGGYNSFLLEYSDGTAEEQSEEAVTFLLSHETIHEYALMSPARQYDLWYREGVAQFYAVVAPFAAGAVDKDYLLRWLNNNAQSTTPVELPVSRGSPS